MSVRDDFDPNTNTPFHLFLLALAFGGIWLTSGITTLLSVPLIAWVASRWIVAGFGYLARKGEAAAVQDWNGRYFAYRELQVRIFWDEEHIWIKATDVFNVLRESPDAISRKKIAARLGKDGYRVPSGKLGECFSETGIATYLNGFRDLETAQFRRWLEREVFVILDKQRECATSAFEQHKMR